MRKEISDIIKEWKNEAGVRGIILISSYPEVEDVIKICVNRPVLMIGKGGFLYNKYLEKLKRVNRYLESIEFIETDGWFIR